MKRLAGKVALVAAGADGIDAATVRALADDGADIAIGYTTAGYEAKALVRELKERGMRAAAFVADECDVAQLERLFKTVAERFGRLDILIWQPCTSLTKSQNTNVNEKTYEPIP
jgi:NAD(P)-dependent dehydrogenase (short-subunit alcohol dehydrogenase family)